MRVNKARAASYPAVRRYPDGHPNGVLSQRVAWQNAAASRHCVPLFTSEQPLAHPSCTRRSFSWPLLSRNRPMIFLPVPPPGNLLLPPVSSLPSLNLTRVTNGQSNPRSVPLESLVETKRKDRAFEITPSRVASLFLIAVDYKRRCRSNDPARGVNR